MARATHGKPCVQVCCLLLFIAICRRTSPCGFARTRQQPLSEIREKTGMAIRKSAAGVDNVRMSLEERELVSKLSRASEKRDWLTAKSLFGTYAGSASPVYAAALKAAWTCRMNKEGARIYESCRRNCKDVGLPTYTTALRIFGKLRDSTMVQQIWNEALSAHDLDEVLGAARIAAAADAGNVTAAAETLDIMNASNVSIDVYHISSAMRACWGWGDKQHKAAKYLFDLMPRLDITPNVVTFTSLIGAYSSLSLLEVLSAYNEMKGLDIEPDRAFAETFVFSLIQLPRQGTSIPQHLRKQPLERLQAVRNALNDFKNAGVRFSRACEEADKSLTDMGF
eukprot:Skav207396  [mRNA]  locus=scaffold2421:124892:125905:+ [translate_table: standard]